jgi:hypothetical protein
VPGPGRAVRRTTGHGPRRIAAERLNRQVSRYGYSPLWGAVLGCILPPRSTCTSVALAQLVGRLLPRLGTRFGLCNRAPTCSPKVKRVDHGSDRPARWMKASATRPEPIFFNTVIVQFALDVHRRPGGAVGERLQQITQFALVSAFSAAIERGAFHD